VLRLLSSPPARLMIVSWMTLAPLNWGCRQRNAPPSTGAAGDGATHDQAPGEEPDESDGTLVVQPIEIPDGTPEELFAFIDDLDQRLDINRSALQAESEERPLAGTGEAELSADSRQAVELRRVMEARVAASEKILVRQVPEESRLRAITIQLDALRTLVALDPEGVAEQFDQYTQRIANGRDPLLARLAKATRFQSDVNRSLSGTEPTGEELIAQLQTLLEDPLAGPEILNATREAAVWLLTHGDRSTATQTFRLVGQRFADHPDETLANAGQSMISQSLNLELTELARGVIEQQPEALEQLLAKLNDLLTPDRGDDSSILPYAMQTAQFLEFSGHPTEALETYRQIGQRFLANPDEQLVADVKQSVALAERRLNLIGQPIEIEGVHLSGNEFDWQSYGGQWVLVCFWATWHQDWLVEVDNILKAIGPYRDPAVSVVSISLDDDRNQVERFLQNHRAPWPVLIDPDPTSLGINNPNAVRCGVEAVPFILLVNPQGVVADVHLMGERLSTALAEHVGKG
jgi:hypothetical protein